MKNCVKFFMIVMSVFVVMEMSAQQMSSNIKFRKPGKVMVTSRYYAPQLDKGHSYDVVYTESNSGSGQMHRMSLSNNAGAGYYHSYGVNSTVNQRVEYNAPTRIDYSSARLAMNSEPFANDVVETANPMRVGREDLPDDPSVPVGSGIVPFLLFAMLWVVYKSRA